MELMKFKDAPREELSMIEVAYAILEETGEVYSFTDLLIVIQEYLGLSEGQLENRMARFYTDINIDGRFISIGENRWGLRAWYPIDSIDEEIVSSIDDEDLPRRRRRKKQRKINAFAEGEDIIDYSDDDPEDVDDIYDDFDEDLEEDEDVDEVDEIVTDDEDEESNEELGVYARDLSELGDDDLDLDEDEEGFEEELEDSEELDDDLDEDYEDDADEDEDED